MSSVLGLTIGAMELGILISSVLYGVMTVQVYIYHKNSAHDSLFIRALITVIWTLETVHTIFAWMYLYRITVTFYGKPDMLQYTYWTLNISAIFDGVIGTIVQSYSAYRIYLLSDRLLIPILSWIGSILRVTCSTAIFVFSTLVPNVREFGTRYQGLATTTLVLAMCVDTLNAVTMSYCLWRQRAGFERTNMLIDKLMLWTMETGAVTSITAILMLVLFQVDSHKYISIWASVSIFYAKVYSNSLLASFNGRSSLQSKLMARSTQKSVTTIQMAVDVNLHDSVDSEMGTLNVRATDGDEL